MIKKYSTRSRIRSQDLIDSDWEIVYELRFTLEQEKKAEEFIRRVKNLPGVEKVSLLAPQLALPM